MGNLETKFNVDLWVDSDDPNYIVGKIIDNDGLINKNYPIIIEFNKQNENLDCYEQRQTHHGSITNLLEELQINSIKFYEFILDKIINFLEQGG